MKGAILATWIGALDEFIRPIERAWRASGGWKVAGPYVKAIAIVLGGYLLARVVIAAIERGRGRARGAPSHGIEVTRKFVFYGLMILTVVLALETAGVNLSGFLAAAGIATVAISFAAQTSVSNVISGIFLLFDRPFSLGDTIRVDTTLGIVQSLGLLSSKVRTFENVIVRIPNEALLKATIMNYSILAVRRIEFSVTVAHEEQLPEARACLHEVVEANAMVLLEPEPIILTAALLESGAQLVARVWVESADFVQASSDLSAAVIAALTERGIERARQRRDIYVRAWEDDRPQAERPRSA